MRTAAQQLMYEEGRRMALDLQSRSPSLDGTGLIAQEEHIPRFDPGKDYSYWLPGYPVKDGGQVWTLLQPHNAAHYEGRPADLRALWGLAHTRDPLRAKPWVDPLGTSGVYMEGECYMDPEGRVFRCRQNQVSHPAAEYPQGWEEVTMEVEV